MFELVIWLQLALSLLFICRFHNLELYYGFEFGMVLSYNIELDGDIRSFKRCGFWSRLVA